MTLEKYIKIHCYDKNKKLSDIEIEYSNFAISKTNYNGNFTKKDLLYAYKNITKKVSDYKFLIERGDGFYYKRLPEEIQNKKTIIRIMLMKHAHLLSSKTIYNNLELAISSLSKNCGIVKSLLGIKKKKLIIERILDKSKKNPFLIRELMLNNICCKNINNKYLILYIKGVEKFRVSFKDQPYIFNECFEKEEMSKNQKHNENLLLEILKVAPYYITFLNVGDYQENFLNQILLCYNKKDKIILEEKTNEQLKKIREKILTEKCFLKGNIQIKKKI